MSNTYSSLDGTPFIALTRLERATLSRIAELHQKYPANTIGFHAGHFGKSKAAAARRLERTGFVAIDRQAGNCFRYSLTEAGKERAKRYEEGSPLLK